MNHLDPVPWDNGEALEDLLWERYTAYQIRQMSYQKLRRHPALSKWWGSNDGVFLAWYPLILHLIFYPDAQQILYSSPQRFSLKLIRECGNQKAKSMRLSHSPCDFQMLDENSAIDPMSRWWHLSVGCLRKGLAEKFGLKFRKQPRRPRLSLACFKANQNPALMVWRGLGLGLVGVHNFIVLI